MILLLVDPFDQYSDKKHQRFILFSKFVQVLV